MFVLRWPPATGEWAEAAKKEQNKPEKDSQLLGMYSC
jgi:hypothetical protein